MPPLARNLIDTNAVAVMADWINSLPGTPALAPPTITPDGGTFICRSVNVTLAGHRTPTRRFTTRWTARCPRPTPSCIPAPFNLTNNATVSASAFATNYNNSVAASALFFVQPLQFTSEAFSAGIFQLGFAGAAGSNYVLQASTNLLNWTPLATNPATTNALNFVDPHSSNYPHRFYRVLQQ